MQRCTWGQHISCGVGFDFESFSPGFTQPASLFSGDLQPSPQGLNPARVSVFPGRKKDLLFPGQMGTVFHLVDQKSWLCCGP